jgi:hypothetical protein
MNSSNWSVPDSALEDNEVSLPSASELLADLPQEVVYAVERGLPEINRSLTSDLDLVITKCGFLILYEIARRRGMVISVTLSYGGARLFIACHGGGIKRIDCMWNCTYLGIPICDMGRLLASRQLDQDTGLYVLAEDMQAKVAFAVKNAYGGAEKYRGLFERHGLQVLTADARRRWLVLKLFKHPLATLTGLSRMMLAYAARIAFPAGIRVYGISAGELTHSSVLRYLFQGRIREAARINAFVRSRLGAELCVVTSNAQADIDLRGFDSLPAAEQAVQTYLCEHRSGVPSLLVTIS